jgi:exodeoxyribonuclease-3
MRIATWNVNSLNARLARVEDWLATRQPDVLCMQETKLTDAKFPHLTFQALGYEVAHYGNSQWNGVAIASKVGLEDVITGFDDDIEDPYRKDCRVISAKCNGVKIVCLYVPNGRELATQYYDDKLTWYGSLPLWMSRHFSRTDDLVAVGDWNVAPEDRDVWKPEAYIGSTHVSAEERAALAGVRDWGLVDAFRLQNDEEKQFTYWDYRGGAFHKGEGMRIDLIYVTESIASRVVDVKMDRDARKGTKPSDHAPVTLEIAD